MGLPVAGMLNSGQDLGGTTRGGPGVVEVPPFGQAGAGAEHFCCRPAESAAQAIKIGYSSHAASCPVPRFFPGSGAGLFRWRDCHR